MVENQHSNFPLSDGFRIRRANFRDSWQLFILMPQIFASNNIFIGSLQILSTYISFMCLIFISLVMFIYFSDFLGEVIINEFAFNTFLVNILTFMLKILLFCFVMLTVIRELSLGVWLVERKQKIIAYAKVTKFGRLLLLQRLCVIGTYRNQGIGSALMSYVTNLLPNPMYVNCKSDLISFYSRFGFKIDRKSSLSRFGINSVSVQMVRNHSSTII